MENKLALSLVVMKRFQNSELLCWKEKLEFLCFLIKSPESARRWPDIQTAVDTLGA